jgi:hypothetical protein
MQAPTASPLLLRPNAKVADQPGSRSVVKWPSISMKLSEVPSVAQARLGRAEQVGYARPGQVVAEVGVHRGLLGAGW